ncbi:hypothetical protein LAZ67_11002274 [Cordylochernes scorpioides]|uniref:Uncharacterized protein n=1 Tax=Cordylochernes scorpioides TaxID=51811 RepID=A0ABY6KZ70_9ARAC|nr:hypothetical protein LAZ67_11002274 [Cordylochernes scorpioides]
MENAKAQCGYWFLGSCPGRTCAPAKWIMGRVVEIHPGKDGLVPSCVYPHQGWLTQKTTEEKFTNNPFGNAFKIFSKLRTSKEQKGIPIIDKPPEKLKEQKMIE